MLEELNDGLLHDRDAFFRGLNDILIMNKGIF